MAEEPVAVVRSAGMDQPLSPRHRNQVLHLREVPRVRSVGVELIRCRVLNSVAASVAASASRAGSAAITTGAADATVAGSSPKSDGNTARIEFKGVTSGVAVIMMGVVAGMLVI